MKHSLDHNDAYIVIDYIDLVSTIDAQNILTSDVLERALTQKDEVTGMYEERGEQVAFF